MHRLLSRPITWLRRLAGPTVRFPRLVDCPHCGCDYVNPVAWEERGDTHWWIRLRCGACGLARELEATNREAQRFAADRDRVLTVVPDSFFGGVPFPNGA